MSADDFMDGKRLNTNGAASNAEAATKLLEIENISFTVLNHPCRGIILTNIMKKLMSDIEAIDVVELIVNETVTRSPHVDKNLTTLLDIKLAE